MLMIAKPKKPIYYLQAQYQSYKNQSWEIDFEEVFTQEAEARFEAQRYLGKTGVRNRAVICKVIGVEVLDNVSKVIGG